MQISVPVPRCPISAPVLAMSGKSAGDLDAEVPAIVRIQICYRPRIQSVVGVAESRICQPDLDAVMRYGYGGEPRALSFKPLRGRLCLRSVRRNPHHSVRKAWTGLMEAARWAGITLATSAQNPRAAMEPTSTTGSQLFTW